MSGAAAAAPAHPVCHTQYVCLCMCHIIISYDMQRDLSWSGQEAAAEAAASSTFPSTLPALIYNFLHFLMPRLPRAAAAGRNSKRAEERGRGDGFFKLARTRQCPVYFWQHIISFICRQNAFQNQISAKTFSICAKNCNVLKEKRQESLRREREREGVYKLSINLFCFARLQFAQPKVKNNMENPFLFSINCKGNQIVFPLAIFQYSQRKG